VGPVERTGSASSSAPPAAGVSGNSNFIGAGSDGPGADQAGILTSRFTRPPHRPGREHVYAALDLGTNNCRLLIARPGPDRTGRPEFRVIDSFSRIVRLGEGLSRTGRLSEEAIERTLGALECLPRQDARAGRHPRPPDCDRGLSSAQNGGEFLARVREEVGLELEIVDRETEAHLAAAGSASLADAAAEGVLLFDIGGGSSEIVWLGRAGAPPIDLALRERVRFWVSLKLGVVTLRKNSAASKFPTRSSRR